LPIESARGFKVKELTALMSIFGPP